MNIPTLFASILSGRSLFRRKRQPVRKAPPRRSRLLVELLEDRCTPATFSGVVDTFSDATDAPVGTGGTGITVTQNIDMAQGIDTVGDGTDPIGGTRTVDLDYTTAQAGSVQVITNGGVLDFNSATTGSANLKVSYDPSDAGDLILCDDTITIDITEYRPSTGAGATPFTLRINGQDVDTQFSPTGDPLTFTITFDEASVANYVGQKITSLEVVMVGSLGLDTHLDRITGDFCTVDANIALSPLEETNNVGEPHTVTATVQQDDGLPPGTPGDAVDGFTPVPDGTPVLFVITNNGTNATLDGTADENGDLDFFNDEIVNTSGGNGTAAITFTSTTAGTVTINAYTTFNITNDNDLVGIEVTRDTDPLTADPHGPGGTDSALKHYVEIPVTGVTRTQGFWFTHTDFTSGIFNDPNGLNGHIIIESGDPNIPDIDIDSLEKLFAGFCASIPKDSLGNHRSADDQARMILLQQLLAAELNLAAFGADSATQDLIDEAEAAFADPASTPGELTSLAGQLDDFNSSGDNGAIPNSLGSPGRATPKASQTLCAAGESFFDTLP